MSERPKRSVLTTHKVTLASLIISSVIYGCYLLLPHISFLGSGRSLNLFLCLSCMLWFLVPLLSVSFFFSLFRFFRDGVYREEISEEKW